MINGRKFDFRIFGLLVGHADTRVVRGYFYEEGYLRTSCKEFSLENVEGNRLVHLTNDAVQKNSIMYGVFESANKLSFLDFEKFLKQAKHVSFYQKILPKIKQQVACVFEATALKCYSPQTRKGEPYNGFELLGFDFMLDEDLNLYLIEVNTNPCMDTPCLLLQRLLPQMLDQTFKLTVDPFLRATEQQYYMGSELNVTELKYKMVFEAPMQPALSLV